jgi:hypothetical protein
VSSGPRATLPTVAEHTTAQRGVVPGDGTSQAAGFTLAATRNPRPVSIATAIGLSAVSPASATNASIGEATRRQARQRLPTATAQDLSPGAPLVLTASSAGNHQP